MTEPDSFPPGTILDYPYLWRWQSDRQESSGRKDRPVCVLVALRTAGEETHLMLLAISSQPPTGDGDALEIPEIERRRGGLNEWKQAWITINEYNYDIAERSVHLNVAQQPRGRFGKSFMMTLAERVRPLLAARQGRIDRL